MATAVTAWTRYGVRFRECGELLCGKEFPLKLKPPCYGDICIKNVGLYLSIHH